MINPCTDVSQEQVEAFEKTRADHAAYEAFCSEYCLNPYDDETWIRAAWSASAAHYQKELAEKDAEITALVTGLNMQNAKVAELEAQTQWIPVSERLPKKGIYSVVVTGDFGKCVSFGYWNSEEWERVQEASEHQSFEPEFSEYGQTITHWMERPPEPQEKE
jgi:roadblock/LC7 domain-containing protein